jgi:hypothetical protein
MEPLDLVSVLLEFPVDLVRLGSVFSSLESWRRLPTPQCISARRPNRRLCRREWRRGGRRRPHSTAAWPAGSRRPHPPGVSAITHGLPSASQATMDLRGEVAAVRPRLNYFKPAACWWARITEESITRSVKIGLPKRLEDGLPPALLGPAVKLLIHRVGLAEPLPCGRSKGRR